MRTKRFCERMAGYCTGITVLLHCLPVAAAPLTWFPGPPLGESRSGAAVVKDPDGRIFLIGGNPAGVTNVLVYGGNNAQPLPGTRVRPGAGALSSGAFYVFGGRNTNAVNPVTAGALAYSPNNPAADADPNILPVSPLNTARYDLGYAADAAGFVYAIGGLGRNDAVLASVERYDSLLDVWTNVASMPEGRYRFSVVFDGVNTFYTFGGRTNTTSGGETATAYGYDVKGNSWGTFTSMPVATAGSAAALGPDGKIYVLGGTAGGVATRLVQVFDPVNNNWQMMTPLPVEITDAAAAVDTLGHLVLLGGVDTNGVDSTMTWASQQLNLSDAAPVFTSSPLTQASCLVEYNYAAHASGNPQPTYQLLTAPEGMTMDYYSGAMVWTPQTNQLGTNLVVIAAGNFSGSTTQSFSIRTIGPPLSAPTNLVESGATTNSVTLSWDPTPYVVGPLSYDLYERTFLHSPRGSGGTYIYHAVAATSTTSATVGGLKPGSAHIYVVRATAAGAISAYSTTAVAVVPLPVNLTVTAPPTLDGGFRFTLQIGASETTRIQATTNPANPEAWETLATNPYTSGTLSFTDRNAGLFPQRYYRVLSP